MTVSDRYLCFSEVRQDVSTFGDLALVEVNIPKNFQKKFGCINLTLLRNAVENQKLFMSSSEFYQTLNEKKGFIKFATCMRPKIEIEVKDKNFSLDLFSMVDFINTFQNPNRKSILLIPAVFQDKEKIIKAFNETLNYLNMGLNFKAHGKIRMLSSLACEPGDLKIAVNLPVQLGLLETPVLKITKKITGLKVEILNANVATDSSDETDSLTNSSDS